ncbi:MAG TPA: carboxymuconolactone decarboxylase family protein [Sporichthya sp.]|nr:carboxymuconolactone decarboxylase family protein [Sporichthya sp.]
MTEDKFAAGMSVRREVLGDAYVDRVTAPTDAVTEEFQRFLTEQAWGAVWTRPGLDRRSRSLITVTALIARGHHPELELHLRGALRNGLTREELLETFLHASVYCGVPDVNAAFRAVGHVLTADPE